MMKRNSWRIAGLLTLVALFVAAFMWCLRKENDIWTGVPLLTQEQYEGYTQSKYIDLEGQILLSDSPAPMDRSSSTIYVTVDPATDPMGWADGVSIRGGYELYFAPDEAFDEPAEAVENGHRFRMLVTAGSENYMEYGVVFTTIPVLKIDSESWDLSTESRANHEGELNLWTPDTVSSSRLQLHLRGSATSWMEKKSWKLSLKTEKGKNNNLSLLGLGEDDDWILNGMPLDDLKLREKLSMDIWGEIQKEYQQPLNMSDGEYVELIANGTYQGLYLLQRRVDTKYLQLSGDYVLMKSLNTYTAENVRDAYELIGATVDEAEAFAITEGFFSGEDYENVDLDSWIDMMLLVQLGKMSDNRGHKNMFYLWQLEQGEWTLHFIPWDTDMSFGIDFEERFVHIPDTVWNKMCIRVEYSGMYALYPDLDQRIAARWQQLRQSAMSDETILSIIDNYHSTLVSSGVMARDEEKWGLFYSDDTIESLMGFLENRLAFLDAYYGAILQ